MNKNVFSKTLSGHRKLELDRLNFSQGGQLQVSTLFPTTEQVVVADVSTTPPSTQYKTLTPAMVGMEDLTAGTNISYNVGTTYNGSTAITISSTDTTYQAGEGINIDTTTAPDTISALVDENTIDFSSGELEVQKVPNSLTAGTNISYNVGSTFDGSTAITINSTDTDTTYQGGDNITIDTATTPDSIDLDPALTGMTGLTYTGGGGNNLTGGGGAGSETIGTYLDLTSDTNLFPTLYPGSVVPYLDVAVYDPTVYTSQALTTSFVQLWSGLMTLTFVIMPGRSMVEIELKVLNGGGGGNKWIYLGLLDGAGTTEWSASMATGGGYGTYNSTTERQVHYKDETDYDYVTMSWILTGLTPGWTYIVNPSAKTNSTSNYIYAGGSTSMGGYPYPCCISRITQL